MDTVLTIQMMRTPLGYSFVAQASNGSPDFDLASTLY